MLPFSQTEGRCSLRQNRMMATPLVGRRVALVSRIYSPEPAAASFRLGALARALRDAGASVTVLTSVPPTGYDDATVEQEGIEIRRAPVLRDRAGYVRGYVQYLSFDLPIFFRLLFARRFDSIVVEPPPTTGVAVRLAAALRRTPYAYYAADIWGDAVESTAAPRLVTRVVRGMERFAISGAGVVLSISPDVTKRLVELGVQQEIATIGNGVDDELFLPDGESVSLDGPYLLYAGTASEVHGAMVFLDAFASVREQIPDAVLAFVGQGSERVELERRAQSFPPGAVRFEARLSPADTARWIRGATATLASVHPERYNLAFPTKMYASVACGVPVIYAGSGPGRDFVAAADAGHAVDYDVAAVAAAMIAALRGSSNSRKRARLAAWARATVSLRAVAARAVTAIAGVTRNPRRSR
jgi:glycosyltransferase involved in cell wall biosynthesis